MAEWQVIPWNLQYLAGGLIALVMTIFIFRREPQATSYRCFLAYGVSVVVWTFSVFLARSAPSLSSSTAFYRIVVPTFLLIQPLFLLTIFQIGSGKRAYYLTLIPAIFIFFYSLVGNTFEISSTSYGWAYSLTRQFLAMGAVIGFGYPFVVAVVLFILVLKSKLLYLKKKYGIILTGFLLYFIPLSITNIAMWRDPNVRPYGGFLLTVEFLFIAYALYLKPDKIEFASSQAANTINENLFKFVRKLRDITPGRELGGDAVHFNNALEAIGLNEVVSKSSSRQTFNVTSYPSLDMLQTMDRITALLRKEQWALQASREYTELFIEIYRKTSKESLIIADTWLDTMLRRHGGFLDRQGILAVLPVEIALPSIFKELPPGKTRLFKEEKPEQAYEKLNQAMEYGFNGLCVTKLEPKKVRAIYGVEKAAIFWLTFREMPTEETVNPKDLERLSSIVLLGVSNYNGNVILFDCLDQVLVANPFEKARGLMVGLKKQCRESKATFLISINTGILTKQQIQAIEEDLEAE